MRMSQELIKAIKEYKRENKAMVECTYMNNPSFSYMDVKKARKTYICSKCGKIIVTGSMYWKKRGKAYHAECVARGPSCVQLKLSL